MARAAKKGLIVVATDGSAPSDLAVDQAAELALRRASRLQVVHVLDLRAYEFGMGGIGPPLAAALPDPESTAQEVLALAVARVRAMGVEPEKAILRGHDASAAIVRHAELVGAELLVVGSHGRTGIPRVLVGSVAERVVRLAPCSVLVVR